MNNYGRFYVLLKGMAYGGEEEELKRSLVAQYTGGRTESLREMSYPEYDRMCKEISNGSDERYRALQRKKRSTVLFLMQRLGIDTTDWARVDSFCKDSRIAGKMFALLSVKELEGLAVKLRMIERHGGLKARKADNEQLTMNNGQLTVIGILGGIGNLKQG